MNKALKQSYTFGKILNLDKILMKNVKKRIFTACFGQTKIF